MMMNLGELFTYAELAKARSCFLEDPGTDATAKLEAEVVVPVLDRIAKATGRTFCATALTSSLVAAATDATRLRVDPRPA